MAIRVAINHVTKYEYDRPVTLSPQIIRLRPAPHTRTPIHGYSLKIEPEGYFINWLQDPQSNHLARIYFPEKVKSFRVEVDVVAELTVINPFDFFLEPDAEHYPFTYDKDTRAELGSYLTPALPGPLLREYLDTIPRKKMRSVDFLVELNRKLQEHIAYLIRLEPGIQTPEETLTKRSGSCRDSAWLLVQILRNLGIAARFVSGYLVQLTPDVKSLDGPSGPEADFTDLHAWAEAYLPGAGWIGFDPTSGLVAGEGHIPLACTPEPSSAGPISGGVEKCETKFDFAMKVTRVQEDPRVTKPYTEEQWASIRALGRQLDNDLKANDVRLTMGGEPTFVSIDDMDGAEWTTDALGPTKRPRAMDLIHRLRERFAPKGVMHFGQGKWYPGESLPRWALACYWRRDGVPMWENKALIADERKNYGFCELEAEKFLRLFASKIGVTDEYVVPGFEDAYYYLWKERRLPVNVDPFKSNLRDKEERARLAKVFEQGLDHTVGYALPLSKGLFGYGSKWVSGSWSLRQERMHLVPGDSPMGYRLPLDSLPWVVPTNHPSIESADPSVPRSPLPMQRRRFGDVMAAPQDLRGQELPNVAPDFIPEPGRSADWVVRTAVCTEARDGRLYVFLPPVRHLEDYIELVETLEHCAEELSMPLIIEGYSPPHDPRLNVIKATPDPGVIEVNIQPASNWEELEAITTGLYEDAHYSRLGTEKFMLDGRHTGTGGGNHIVVGGPTPLDSPFLRRPDMLRSLIAYWNNHPSLSYLFSGLFVGPTSQAPRIDEARNDQVYELSLAFEELRRQQGNVPPWLTDRIFRNLLIDVTGNTHRAEFCIDKLYAPESSSGRLGLVEFRAFEMPPHAQMSLAQQLLLRSFIARFWNRPYEAPMVPWGTELHDRFMLPHFVWQDFADVIGEMKEHGYPLAPEWFAPHYEFRFPHIGNFGYRDVEVDLRTAIEPWHVMGEEPGAGGTVRYVDSSLERIEVKVRGLVDTRHTLVCNGKAVPLKPTGVVGEYVAGIRFRAWQPSACLHPTIEPDVPLVFDLYDTWNDRAMSGCTYHVAHPGGRNYTTFPVNAYEAEARRVARFFKHGHTPGKSEPVPARTNRDFPFTLDMRL